VLAGHPRLRNELRETLVEEIGCHAAIYSLESDKSVQEVESPASGTLQIIAPAGELYQVGALVAKIA